jgi:hypothetical protein
MAFTLIRAVMKIDSNLQNTSDKEFLKGIEVVFFFHWLYSPRGPWPLFQFHDHFNDGRTPWASDQLVARPLPKHRKTQTKN